MQVSSVMSRAAPTSPAFSGSNVSRRSAAFARERIVPALRASPEQRAKEAREKGSDDNPFEAAAKDFEKNVAEPVNRQTQEASGINPPNLNQSAYGAKDSVGAFAETQSFAGLAPEITNGRGAMVAWLAAAGAEIGTREPVLQQLQRAPIPIALTFALIILGSVVPIIRGADLSAKGAGPFTPRAEIWNGRLAMVSFVILLFVESVKGGPGIVP